MQEGLQEGLQQGLQQGLQEGLQQGLQQELHKARVKMARHLLSRGLAMDIIVETTGLSEEEIRGSA